MKYYFCKKEKNYVFTLFLFEIFIISSCALVASETDTENKFFVSRVDVVDIDSLFVSFWLIENKRMSRKRDRKQKKKEEKL